MSGNDCSGADAPIRVRKRVPRACEPCRRRKVKCDGKEPCQCCVVATLSCMYLHGAVDSNTQSDVDQRLQSLESMFQTLLARFEAQQRAMDALVGGLRKTDTSGETEQTTVTTNPTPDGRKRRRLADQDGAETQATPKRRRQTPRPTYADAFGELRPDEQGHLRYLGLGSTLRLIDVCRPFRQHLDRGLAEKGYGNGDTVFAYPTGRTGVGALSSSNDAPPPELTAVLVQWYFARLHYLFPIITRADFAAQMACTDAEEQGDFQPVLYGVLAMAALSVPAEKVADAAEPWQGLGLASLLFRRSVASNRCYPLGAGMRRSLSAVMGLALQAAYLASEGQQAEAWVAVGQAVRLGQDLGLHRSPGQLGFGAAERGRRRRTWWCIYSLDRTVSAALGRPFGVRDVDCDVEMPGEEEPEEDNDGEGEATVDRDGEDRDSERGFVAVLRLRQILGQIVDAVAAVRRVQADRRVGRIPAVRAAVVALHSRLQTWSTSEVPAHVKHATAADGSAAHGQRLIALSGYQAALVLLYRFLVANPHRPSALADGEALGRCVRAASHCIRLTGPLLAGLPASPDRAGHAQHVFAAAMVLLHAIRRRGASDRAFVRTVLRDVERAQRVLRRLQAAWPAAHTLAGSLEEYLELILACLERGLDSGQCAFHHDAHERTGLEWRDGPGDGAVDGHDLHNLQDLQDLQDLDETPDVYAWPQGTPDGLLVDGGQLGLGLDVDGALDLGLTALDGLDFGL